MANALAGETSPYLLQHQHNPVDWRPWSPAAFAEARERDVPVLVSIGYSACHWCHVMERESFEDDAVAALMNERFVCIKVDREERPDVDAIYMDAVQAMTGHGGWPLNAFATPDQVPFYAGTYFPPQERPGMPSWTQVLTAIADAWAARRDEIVAEAARIVSALGGAAALRPEDEPPTAELLAGATDELVRRYDEVHGGWGAAPKFPAASAIELLLRRGETGRAAHALLAMARGGIYDQVGGGFARYAVDATWTVPHFEKMLYDNALLARAYLHGVQVTGEQELARVCTETLDWMLRELAVDGPEQARAGALRVAAGQEHEPGAGQPGAHGFASAYDADSEGVEGKFYVWTVEELRAVLGEELAEPAIAFFGASERGNFEGANVLEGRGPQPDALPEIRRRLLAVRAERVWPGLDDKRLTSWNALAIAAFADAGAVLGRDDYRDAAVACAEFVLRELRDERGRLLRTWKDGRAHLDAYLEDHAFLLEALLTLYETTFDERWFRAARELGDAIVARFADREHGGFFTTADDHERLVARRKDLDDTPIPSGNASAAFGLLRLAALTGEYAYEQQAVSVLRLLGPLAARQAQPFAHLLQALDFHLGPVREIALVGEDRTALEAVVRERLRPYAVLAAGAGGDGTDVPLLTGRGAVDGHAAAYVCERMACQRPVTTPDALRALLDA